MTEESKFPYCLCGEREGPDHQHAPGKCVDSDCWIGSTIVGWPHDSSLECGKTSNSKRSFESKSNIIEEVFAIRLPGETSRKWDERFLRVAELISTWSKDPSTKVGAHAVNPDRRMLVQGYNGFPSGCQDSKYDMDDRIAKYQMVIHAESNLIYNAVNTGVSLKDSTVFIYGMYPCPECVKALAQVGVVRLVFQLGISKNVDNWKNWFDLSRVILHDVAIGFTHYADEKSQAERITEYHLRKELEDSAPIAHDDNTNAGL